MDVRHQNEVELDFSDRSICAIDKSMSPLDPYKYTQYQREGHFFFDIKHNISDIIGSTDCLII